jgi:transcription initiation factor TFIID TATA-box-binding protein
MVCIENVVATASIDQRAYLNSIAKNFVEVARGGKIRLEEAARLLPKSMYEPEQFPGLIRRMPDPKTVILLFTSGKLVCTGAKREGDVYRAVNNLHMMLEEKGLMTY